MKVEILIAEIGSTTTVVNAFAGIGSGNPRLRGQGFSPTTVAEGDVTLGLTRAVEDLKSGLQTESLSWDRFLASSSAAGGLRMTVHGLVHDMTVRAAREAALGAGANIHQITAGPLRRSDLNKLVEINPNIIMIAGGVDYGERNTALDNAEKIAELDLRIPVIYAGNIQNHEEMREIFEGTESRLYIVDNVYPSIDRLDVLPARKAIQDIFEEHIVYAPGMEKIRSIVDGPVLPTPGAVMEASFFLKESLGDLVTFDVGGATTDVHSVTEGSSEVNLIQLYPEPLAKRTVEGDLGVYINRLNVIRQASPAERVEAARICGIEESELESAVMNLRAVPENQAERMLAGRLTAAALKIALGRHVGRFHNSFTAEGKRTLAEGRDLTAISHIIGTGGALTRLDNGADLLREAFESAGKYDLLPQDVPKILIDSSYIMAALGIISREYPDDARLLFSDYIEEQK